MKISSYLISGLIITLLWGMMGIGLTGCEANNQGGEPENEELEGTTEVETETEEDKIPENSMDSMTSRGLGMANARLANYSFQTSFPRLFDIIKDDGFLLKDMEDYAKKIMVEGEINTEEDVFNLLKMRDSTILRHLESPVVNYLDEVSNSDEEAFESTIKELERIGISINMAEGMVTGLSAWPVLEGKIAEINSPTLTAFINFQNADAESMSGEYPFSNMKPYEVMVLSGEILIDNQPNPYFELIENRFYSALSSLADVHLVFDPNARQEGAGNATVGGVNTDPYPYMTETETISEFAQKHTESKYGQALARISENMSEMSSKPENLYIIITEWIEELPTARMRVAKHLANGEDIPHYLNVKRGDGKEYYAIAYRFYDDSEKASAALEKIKPDFPDAKMIFVSVKGDELYQLGPSN